MGRGDYRNYSKGPVDKTKGEGGGGGGRWVRLGWGGGMGKKGVCTLLDGNGTWGKDRGWCSFH